MHPLVAVLALGSLIMLSRPALAWDPGSMSVDWTHPAAEQDFEAVRGALGLSGSSPLVGLEPLAIEMTSDDGEARRDFEAMHAELGLSGSAPLAGLEAYALTIRPAVAYVVRAASAESSDGGR